MKKMVIGAMMLGLASLSHAQNANGEFEVVRLKNVDVTSTNKVYEDKVCSENLPNHVIELERTASRFKIRESMFFDKTSKDFEINFIAENGDLTATYDRNGKILRTSERFKNLTFPFEIRNSIYRKYPDWTIHKDAYLVSYDHVNGAKKVYRAQLRKNGKRINVMLDGHNPRLD